MTMRRRDFFARGSAAALVGALPDLAAFAQPAFPTRQIHLVVPASAGGVHDVFGRLWADRVKGSLGTMVVENRAGGGSSIALNYVVQQAPDGHTLLVGSTSTLVLREGGNNRAYDKEWADKPFQKKLVESGFEPMLGFGPERSDRYLKEEFAKWNPIVQRGL